VQILRACFSEYALVRARVIVEIRWLQKLADIPQITEVGSLVNKLHAVDV
jgi:adenylosuccinate lyase